jgi:lipopolysaccharide/colanic/teichoic acid biosynthesis glycosyltransferase
VRLLRNRYRSAKPFVDAIGALVLLVLLAPLMGLCHCLSS